ncbi:M50 family metallopeptidase [Maricaulis salignorans]|uniref:Site-2 protease. Metallo peptidase. MEROPS family M50B n=1 Tax=Maricaulis salignorans TaxID=144026 RepID=A0A1G9V9S4_9PROT|nr:M50 family metallopeptidase [Maricaulis salignorans]SDM68919.1 site-2 protease. Metallo peptidase. MEROPS family M50B [Maricaulis salignorans]
MSLIGSGFLTIFSFVFLISIVVVIHELGHYWAGRVCGVHAEAFSMGFGPTLVSWRDKQGTVWRIAAFPLGGYVKFLGDAGAASEPDEAKLAEIRERMGADAEKCYHFKPIWQRAFITAAGPIANFILAITIFASLALSLGVNYLEPVVGGFTEDSTAEQAGFQVGDRITAINAQPVDRFRDITSEVSWRPGERLTFQVERDGESLVLEAAAALTTVADSYGGERQIARLGIQSTGVALRRTFNPVTAISYGMDQTWTVVSMTGRYVSYVVTGRSPPTMLNGPLGIATTAGQTAISSVEHGDDAAQSVFLLLINLVNLAGFLSVGLGLVNLLPIPILDGGHLVYYAYEAVARRPLSMKAQAIGFRVGLALVLGMMLVATWNDLNYLLGQIF